MTVEKKKKKHKVNDSREHKRAFLHVGWGLGRVCVALCGQATLMHCLSYLTPGKVNEVVALLEGSRNGMSSGDQRKLSEMKRPGS